MTDGILCVHKEQDWTSFDVVAKCRRITGCRKAGHGGTLDPMATGVLPLFFGRATRAIDLAPVQQKRYTASFQLGIATETQDIWGAILEKRRFDAARPAVEAALSRFVGEISQLPPMYSAVQVDGRRLYDLARKGIEVERAPRGVTVYSAVLTAYDAAAGAGTLDIRCSRGTYIRTIIHDLGQALGCGAAMTALCRTETLGFSLDRCVTVSALAQAAEQGRLDALAIPLEQLFDSLPAVALDAVQTRLFRCGATLELSRVAGLPPQEGSVRLYDAAGVFAGLARCDFARNELATIKQF